MITGVSGGSTERTHRVKWWRVYEKGGVSYLIVSFMVFSLIGFLYTYMMYDNNNDSIGCQEDSEGSWSIGVFYGDSPFSLKPIEDVSP